MRRQVLFLFMLAVGAFTTTHNCLGQALAGGQAPGQNPAPQTKPAAPPAPHDHSHMAKTAAEESSPAQKYFTDVELLNQDGKKVRFYSDVLKGKTVVVNAFFTTCTSVCPPMNRNMEKIQEVLGDRVGRDVFLVSMTVDPENDTPARIKEYAQKFHAGPGWIFLTGKKENLDWALYKLGQYVEQKDDHKTIFIIGNEPTGLWKKAFAMANVRELVQVVESVVNDKGADVSKTK
jgi:protein SCO1